MPNHTDFLIAEAPNPNSDVLHLIGEEWALKGVGAYVYSEPPPPCIIDGTPLNACTGVEH